MNDNYEILINFTTLNGTSIDPIRVNIKENIINIFNYLENYKPYNTILITPAAKRLNIRETFQQQNIIFDITLTIIRKNYIIHQIINYNNIQAILINDILIYNGKIKCTNIKKIYTTKIPYRNVLLALTFDDNIIICCHPNSYKYYLFPKTQLQNVKEIYPSLCSFVILKKDGNIFDTSLPKNDYILVNYNHDPIKYVCSSADAHAGLTYNGGVITWGKIYGGGDSSMVRNHLQSGIIKIFSTLRAFAVLKEDGSVITWGDPEYGGDSSIIKDKLASGVKEIYSTDDAFAVLKEDGSIVSWGNAENNKSFMGYQLQNNIKQICSSNFIFTALTEDNKIITWGDLDDMPITKENIDIMLNKIDNINQIISTNDTFAILTKNNVITWGHPYCKVNNLGIINHLTDVVKLFSTYYSFAALKNDGSIISWKCYDSHSHYTYQNVINIIPFKTCFCIIFENNNFIIQSDNEKIDLDTIVKELLIDN